MPWVVNVCGRRGAEGAESEGFLLVACVTQSSFSSRRNRRESNRWYGWRSPRPACEERSKPKASGEGDSQRVRLVERGPSPRPSPRKSGAREKRDACVPAYIVLQRADCHTPSRRVVGSRFVWLGFSATPGKPDALQFICVHFSVPAGGAGGLFRAWPQRKSGAGGVAGAGLAGFLCPRQLAICSVAAGFDRVQLRRRLSLDCEGFGSQGAVRGAHGWRRR